MTVGIVAAATAPALASQAQGTHIPQQQASVAVLDQHGSTTPTDNDQHGS